MSIDHVTLVLTGSPDESTNGLTARKSLRRTWNQLPRCQRNLIILALTAICVIVFLFLPTDPIVNDKNVGVPLSLKGSKDYEKISDNKGVLHKINKLKDEMDLEASSQKFISKLAEETINQSMADDGLKDIEKIENNHKNNKDTSINTSSDDVKIHINEINGNLNDNEVNKYVETSIDGERLESIIQKPLSVPNGKDIEIEKYVDNLESYVSIITQKQHFHGATNEKQIAVVEAFKHAWYGYKKFAWGHDNLKPISQTGHDWFGLGLTIIDSLDTMYIMGLEDEFNEAREWVNNNLKFDGDKDVNLFEVTIRVLGGLLSAYHLSGDKMFLKKSIELGNRLLPCFLSPSGIPYSDVNLSALSAHSPKWSPDSSTSEVTTIQLEFRDLSRSINVPIYEKLIDVVNEKIHNLEKKHGLVPIFINANTGTFRNYATISLGARGDSYYEYLLKQWLQTGRKDNDKLVLDYMHSIDGVLTKLMRRTPKEQHVYIGELINGKDFKPKMDHLTCYLPGTLILGHKYGMPDSHLILAQDLLETCYQTYMKQETHLAPEITHFAVNANDDHDIIVKPNDAHNLLRPEFIESLYYFYALTGNRTYQDMGWTIFQAFEKHTKVAGGYTSIGNVKNVLNTRLRDMMESFWLGETLKYFYLLFSDNRNEIDLDKWIFNTEAHPLPVRNH